MDRMIGFHIFPDRERTQQQLFKNILLRIMRIDCQDLSNHTNDTVFTIEMHTKIVRLDEKLIGMFLFITVYQGFKRGSVKRFLMALPRDIGQLSHLRIWSDGSGKGSAHSWLLDRIVIQDIQKDIGYENILIIMLLIFCMAKDILLQ